ncbi:MAG: hypothetical protein ACXVW2_17565 [Nocardioidaceae bacterium]
MSASRLASWGALAVGVVWIGAAVLGWGGDAMPLLYYPGLLGAVIVLAAFGYSLVAKAPVWLRLIVSVCNASLGLMLWITAVSAVGVKAIVVLAAGIVLLACGLIGLPRSRQEPAAHAVVRGGRRAAR